jgi:hypothetical protein
MAHRGRVRPEEEGGRRNHVPTGHGEVESQVMAVGAPAPRICAAGVAEDAEVIEIRIAIMPAKLAGDSFSFVEDHFQGNDHSGLAGSPRAASGIE